MADIQVKTHSGGMKSIEGSSVTGFAEQLQGGVLHPGHADYDETRAIWNAMIDRRPGLIVQCIHADDVVHTVNFAREHGLVVSVRGAGHNIAGNAVVDDVLMIDLSGMKSVKVDPENKTAVVEPGVTLGELDSATIAHNLALPVGINSTTGISGLTLGGGYGWLSRKYGLTIDNLLSANVVTASGEVITASAGSNSDLFWGVRGGGGNFGVVTSFEFKLNPCNPEILSGLIIHPIADAPKTLRFLREFLRNAPDELTVWTVLRKAPPLPFLAESVHGTPVMIMAAFYSDDMADGERILKPLRDFGNPHADVIGPHPYTGWQQAFDPLLTPGVRNYWKSHNFKELSDEALDTLLRFMETLPGNQCEIFMAQLGGATSRVTPDATAYNHRDAEYTMNVHGRWEDPGDDAQCRRWCRDLFEAMEPFSSGGVYVNFMPEDESGRVPAAYGEGYPRLVALKKKYDPGNTFRYNQNIDPNGS